MRKTDGMSRFASSGLAAVLFVLTIYSICATIITLAVINQAQESAHMSNLYQQIHYSVSSEDSLLHQYYLNPSSVTWAEYVDSTDRLNSLFHAVQHDGDSGDRAFVKSISVEQTHFQQLTLQLSHAITTHQMARAKYIHDVAIDIVFDGLEAQANNAENADHIQNLQSMNKLSGTQQTIIISTSVVFAMSLLLFGLFARMLHSYQVRLNQASRDQLLQMEQAALTDPLTGLPNHRAIIQRIETEIQYCSTTQYDCAIIFVDVDHFKQINDTWGHAAGDAALYEVGQRLQENVRAGDYVGRYGGEEFAILLTNVEQYEAFELAERLRCAISETPCLWQREDAQATTVAIPLTASFGLSIFPLDGVTGKELIELADTAMYIAKRTGRNQVCLPDAEQAAQLNAEESKYISSYAEDEMTQVLSSVAALRDAGTFTHGQRMVELAEAITRQLGRSEEEVTLIRLAAQMHDIGKIGIPDAILHKPGSLTQEEWSVMRRHPSMGQQLLAQAGGRFELISHIVVAHHERYDGTGYPYGLAGEQIPLGARILSVIDSYDAMTSTRSYRKALSVEYAMEELQRCAGSQYDPAVVEAFLQVLQRPEELQKSSVSAAFC